MKETSIKMQNKRQSLLEKHLQSWTKVNGTTTKNGIVFVATSN